MAAHVDTATAAEDFILLPQGWTTIAQRFSVGGGTHRRRISPEGTAEIVRLFSRPFGTWQLRTWLPDAEALGYGRRSLRDKDLARSCNRYRGPNSSIAQASSRKSKPRYLGCHDLQDTLHAPMHRTPSLAPVRVALLPDSPAGRCPRAIELARQTLPMGLGRSVFWGAVPPRRMRPW